LITDSDFFGSGIRCEQGRGHEADHAGGEAAQDIGKRWHRFSLSFGSVIIICSRSRALAIPENDAVRL
jgi:hypothetical protein